MNPSAASPSPDNGHFRAGCKVVVYDYYTFVADGRSVKKVRSAKPATLDLIQDLDAEAVPGSAREVESHDVCDLGFFRSANRASAGTTASR